MGRMIDADALAAEVTSWKRQQHSMNIDYSTGYRSALSAVEGMIAQAQTVDAIPVDWLNKQCGMADDRGDMEMTDAISWLIQTWQEEQEAR